MEITALEKGRGGLGWAEPVRFRGGKLGLRQELELLGEIDEGFREDMDHKARALQAPAHREKARGHDRESVPGEDLRPDDDIGDVGLVLERHEDDALGGSRHLPHENKAGYGDLPVLRQIFATILAGAQCAVGGSATRASGKSSSSFCAAKSGRGRAPSSGSVARPELMPP